MDISQELIEQLANMAGIDTTKAKEVLQENSGNIEMAMNFLQEQGLIKEEGIAGMAMGALKGFMKED